MIVRGQNLVIQTINDNNVQSETVTPLSESVYNMDKVLSILFPNQENIIDKLASDDIRIVPVRKTANPTNGKES
jgi:hypothetical protein